MEGLLVTRQQSITSGQSLGHYSDLPIQMASAKRPFARKRNARKLYPWPVPSDSAGFIAGQVFTNRAACAHKAALKADIAVCPLIG
jgi:hypothetical protein